MDRPTDEEMIRVMEIVCVFCLTMAGCGTTKTPNLGFAPAAPTFDMAMKKRCEVSLDGVVQPWPKVKDMPDLPVWVCEGRFFKTNAYDGSYFGETGNPHKWACEDRKDDDPNTNTWYVNADGKCYLSDKFNPSHRIPAAILNRNKVGIYKPNRPR